MKFVTAITCIDGRAQQPVTDYLRQACSVDFVDMITAPGVDKLLADEATSAHGNILKNNASISIKAHSSKVIAVVSHYDCAGNPVNEKQHKQHVRAAVHAIKTWNLNVRVIGLWVDETWNVCEVDE